MLIWDFGGRDVYLGAHAIFLRSHAVLPILWTTEAEEDAFHTAHDDLHPLGKKDSVAEQALFLQMMRSCRICFVFRRRAKRRMRSISRPSCCRIAHRLRIV
ncbi:MAG: hypothetical protein MRY74_00445 [Neomegalonema sp.]|nr:hypothetical protein [Neomegalonema sp.]